MPVLSGPASASASAATPVSPAIVEIRKEWADDWEFVPHLRFVSGTATAAGRGMGTAEFVIAYGDIMHPWETAYTVRETVDLNGYWVRVKMVGDEGYVTVWIGLIDNEVRDIYGDDTAQPSGVQRWVAAEPIHLLRKIDITQSVWEVDAEEKTLGYAPDMNARDAQRQLVGNKIEGSEIRFGGAVTWDNHQFLDYIVTNFCDESDTGGPTWTIGGQLEVLDSLTDTINGRGTAAEIISRLVSKEHGLDWKIIATDDGFEVHVYALHAEEWSFAGATLQKNPNTVRIRSDDLDKYDSVRIVGTQEQKYDTIRIEGKPIVICTTLRGDLIEGRWDSALESEYVGFVSFSDDPDENDALRQQDKYRDVFQSYGAPDDYTRAGASPSLDDEGELTEDSADYQTAVRHTLSWTPLVQGTDYTTDPPTAGNGAGEEEYRPLCCWVYSTQFNTHLPADAAGVSVIAPAHEWGVFLSAAPNHLLAFVEWDYDQVTNHLPIFDGTRTVVTLAFLSEWPLSVEAKAPDSAGEPSGGIKVIKDSTAEAWYLSAGTVVDYDFDGNTVTNDEAMMLRNDNERLHLKMAGALSRYSVARARAEITMHGLHALNGLIGQILTVVEQAGDASHIQAAITSVAWEVSEDGPVTIVRTGFSQ